MGRLSSNRPRPDQPWTKYEKICHVLEFPIAQHSPPTSIATVNGLRSSALSSASFVSAITSALLRVQPADVSTTYSGHLDSD